MRGAFGPKRSKERPQDGHGKSAAGGRKIRKGSSTTNQQLISCLPTCVSYVPAFCGRRSLQRAEDNWKTYTARIGRDNATQRQLRMR